MDNNMKFDTYTLKGRIVPAFFSIILPIMTFNHFFISEEFSKAVGEILGAKLISNLTISTICLYFLSEFGRLIGKNVFERIYFQDEFGHTLDGQYAFQDLLVDNDLTLTNPVAYVLNKLSQEKNNRLIGKLNATLRPFKGLTLRVDLGGDFSGSKNL